MAYKTMGISNHLYRHAHIYYPLCSLPHKLIALYFKPIAPYAHCSTVYAHCSINSFFHTPMCSLSQILIVGISPVKYKKIFCDLSSFQIQALLTLSKVNIVTRAVSTQYKAAKPSLETCSNYFAIVPRFERDNVFALPRIFIPGCDIAMSKRSLSGYYF